MYYFIVNPNSRSGKGKKIWRRLEKQLINSGVEYEAHLTEKPGDASDFAALLTEGCKEPRIIVAMGGDGTVNEVLNGLAFCGQRIEAAQAPGTMFEEDLEPQISQAAGLRRGILWPGGGGTPPFCGQRRYRL